MSEPGAQVIEQLQRVSTATLTMVLLKHGIRNSWLHGPKPLEPMQARVVGLHSRSVSSRAATICAHRKAMPAPVLFATPSRPRRLARWW